MARVHIERSQGMSNTTYHRRTRARGQRWWWMRNLDTGAFVEITDADGSRVRGDHALDVTLDLPPGRYQLGTGPQGHGHRETIEVSEDTGDREDEMETYAIINSNDTIITHRPMETDERAQDWFRSEGGRAPRERLVCLDLGEDEEPACGAEVDVDDDGVARMR